MGKKDCCFNPCPEDWRVYAAASDAYNYIGVSDVPTLRALLENPEDGIITIFKCSSCSCCSDCQHAKIFTNFIRIATAINYYIPFPTSTTPQIPPIDLTPAQIALLTLKAMIALYQKYPCRCKDDEKKLNKNIQNIFLETTNNILLKSVFYPTPITNDFFTTALLSASTSGSVLVPTFNLTPLTAYVHYLCIYFEVPPPDIVKNQPNYLAITPIGRGPST